MKKLGFALVALSLTLSGCGYHVAGRSDALPPGVHVVSVQPKLEKGRMSVHFTVGASSDDAKIKFLRAMESSPAFSNVVLLNVRGPGQSTNGTDEAILDLTAVYTRT